MPVPHDNRTGDVEFMENYITQNNFWKKVSHHSFDNSLSVNLSVDNFKIQGRECFADQCWKRCCQNQLHCLCCLENLSNKWRMVAIKNGLYVGKVETTASIILRSEILMQRKTVYFDFLLDFFLAIFDFGGDGFGNFS